MTERRNLWAIEIDDGEMRSWLMQNDWLPCTFLTRAAARDMRDALDGVAFHKSHTRVVKLVEAP